MQMGNHDVSSALTGKAFDDDPGGLELLHDRAGLLSAANSGPNTNTGHFSIMVNPAPHLNGHYTIFGEVVEGMDVVEKIRKVQTGSKGMHQDVPVEPVIIQQATIEK